MSTKIIPIYKCQQCNETLYASSIERISYSSNGPSELFSEFDKEMTHTCRTSSNFNIIGITKLVGFQLKGV